MDGKNKKKLHDFFVLFFKACLIFSIIVAAGFGGFILFATKIPDNDMLVEQAASQQDIIASTQDTELPSSVPVSVTLKDNGLIEKNIFVNSVDIGGLSKTEAENLLEEKLAETISDKNITFLAGDNSYSVGFSHFNVTYDIKSAVSEAFNYTRNSDNKVSNEHIKFLDNRKYEIQAKVVYDTDELTVYLNNIAHEVNVAPVEPLFQKNDGVFVFGESSIGKSILIDKAKTDANNLIMDVKSGNVNIEFEDVAPRCTIDHAHASTNLLGKFSTNYSGGSSNLRNKNIMNACSKINNTTLYPGDVFSTNAILGEMSTDNGYYKAPTILGNKLVDDYGGGVCQVSSTLYNAILYSELEIVERTNHSLKVGYLDYAYDATLADDFLDLKFRNNTSFPVLIESYASSGSVVVNVYGHETRPENRTISFENEFVSKVSPGGEIVSYDSNLSPNQRVVDVAAKTGYVYNLYKNIYIDNQVVDRVLVNVSKYKAVRAEVRVGTGGGSSRKSTPDVQQDAPSIEDVNQQPPAQQPPAQQPPEQQTRPEGQPESQTTQQPVQPTQQPEQPAQQPEQPAQATEPPAQAPEQNIAQPPAEQQVIPQPAEPGQDNSAASGSNSQPAQEQAPPAEHQNPPAPQDAGVQQVPSVDELGVMPGN